MGHPGNVPIPAVLRGHVRAVHSYEMSGFQPGEHIGLPTAGATCVIDLGDGLRLSGLGLSAQTTFGTCAAGLMTRPATIHHDGAQRGVMLYLTPLGTRTLLRTPIAELAGRVAPIEALLGSGAQQLRERMAAAPLSRAAQILLTQLHRRLPEAVDASLGLQVWNRLLRSPGRYDVRGLAAQSGWSERYLRGQFRAELGIGMTTAARLIRFEAALPHLERPGSLAQVAAHTGYADQAHLTREWRSFTGLTPGVWRTHEEFVPA